MSKVSIRRLLARLAALAVTTGVAGPAIAHASAHPQPDADDCLVADVPIDTSDVEPGTEPADAAHSLGRGLALALSEMRPLGATQLASAWALSEFPMRRLAVAHALEWTFKLVGDDLIIDHLSRDPDPAVRFEAARAAWVRRASGGDAGVLARLAEDPDPKVRAMALRARV